MAFCSNCGKKIEDDSNFCSGCGKALGNTSNENFTPIMQPAVIQTQSITSNEKYCFSCGGVIHKDAEMCPKCGVNQNKRNSTTAIDVYCSSCGKTIKKEASMCPFCGVVIRTVAKEEVKFTGKNKTTAIICWLFGVHRFYVGKIGTNILYWLTAGGLGIWSVIDIILICTDKFTDKQGNPLKKNWKIGILPVAEQ